MDNTLLREADHHAPRGLRFCLVLLFPTVLVGSLFAALSSPRAARCLNYGEECSPVPVDWIVNVCGLAAFLGIVAVAWHERSVPFRHARSCLICLYLLSLVAMAAMILSYA